MSDYDAFVAAQERYRKRREMSIQPAIATAALKLRLLDDLPVVDGEPAWCPDCHDTGYRVRPDGGAGAATRCDCRVPQYDGPESIPAAVLESYGCARSVSSDLASTWDHKLGKWPAEADVWPAGIRDDSGARPKWLFIHGPEGNGKSRVAAWIMRRAMAAGMACWWIDVPKTIQEARRAIGNAEKQLELNAWMAARMARQIVILDDLGAHRDDSEWQVQDLVAAWVRERHESAGWNVATSNLAPHQLRDFYPRRTVSRICAGKIIEMKGGDARRRPWHVALANSIRGAR